MLEGLDFDFWNFLGGLIAGGIGGSFLTLKLSKSQKADSGGKNIDQSGAKAGGDIVGGNKRS